MKVKIISDGSVPGTEVVNVETGESISGVVSVEWSIDAETAISQATIVVKNVQLELTGDAAMEVLPAYAALAILEGKAD